MKPDAKVLAKLLRIVVFALIPLPSLWALTKSGFFDPHDTHHLADIYEMFRAFTSGQLPPRLGPDFSFGYTYPLFNYYYLLPFYIGSLFYWMLGSLTTSFKAVLIVGIVVSYLGMYKLLRRHFSFLASVVGASLFLYTPYRAVQIYVRGALGEALALAILPWVLYFAGKYLSNPNSKNLAFGALVFFLFIISHNYFFALSVPVVFLYGLVNIRNPKRYVSGLLGLFVMCVLGAGIAAYWLIPGITEKNLVAGETPFPMADHFPFISQLIIPSWGYGASVWGIGDGISFQIGLINLAAIAVTVALLFFYYTGRYKKISATHLAIVKYVIAGFAASFIFMNIRTFPVWQLMPLYNMVQFPWRLLSFTTFFSSIAAAFVIDSVPQIKHRLPIAVLAVGLMFGVSFLYFHPGKIFHKQETEYLNLFFNNSAYSEDYLLLPNWVEKRPVARPDTMFNSLNSIILSEAKLGLLDWNAQVESEGVAQMEASLYYFPGWILTINGLESPIWPSGPFGKITFEVPAGKSQVNLRWRETPTRLLADILSLCTLAITAILIIFPSKVKRLRANLSTKYD